MGREKRKQRENESLERCRSCKQRKPQRVAAAQGHCQVARSRREQNRKQERARERDGEVAETESERQSTEIEMQTEKRECNAWKNLANKNIQNFRAIKATLERATCRTYRRTHTHTHTLAHTL